MNFDKYVAETRHNAPNFTKPCTDVDKFDF